MNRYLIMGIGGAALAAAVWVFASGSLGTASPGVSMETTASIPAAAHPASRPAAGGPAAGGGDEGGHAISGDWVAPR